MTINREVAAALADSPAMPDKKATSHAPARRHGHRSSLLTADGFRAGSIASLSLLLGAGFVGVSLYYNQGHLIPPLDDVYIHLQYGRQLGEGHFLQYNTGDPISSGASSLLYALILGAGYAVGLRGPFFLSFAVGFGILCFALSTICVFRLGQRLVNRTVGTWAGVLVATNGAVLWGAASGMEVGLVELLLVASLLAFVREAPTGRFLLTPMIATLTALSRPEGLIFAVAICVAMWATIGRTAVGLGQRMQRAAVSSLPLAAGAGQLLFYKLATGTSAANGVRAKSYLYAPVFYPGEFIDQTMANLQRFLGVFGGLSTQEFVFPGALAFFVVGICALVRHREQRSLGLAVGIGFVAVLLATSTLMTALWQNMRYAQPFIPIFLLITVIGANATVRAIVPGLLSRSALFSVLSVALLFTLSVLPTWGLRLGQEAATIREAPVSIGSWLAGNVPPGASIAVNDVGATAYFSGHRIVDLIGLTTNELTEPTYAGMGSLYEALRRMPEEQRPDYFSIYDSWGGPPFHDLADVGLLGNGPLITFTLTVPARPSGALPSPCQSDRSCTAVSVYHADWSLAGSGDQAHLRSAAQVRDYLNIGDLDSERAHAYVPQLAQIGLQPTSILRRVSDPDGSAILDSGRHIVGGERFTVHDLIPGRPMTIIGRIAASGPQSDLRTSADGVSVGTWMQIPDNQGWRESTFTIPGNLITRSTVDVELAGPDPLLAPYPNYFAFAYWFSQ